MLLLPQPCRVFTNSSIVRQTAMWRMTEAYIGVWVSGRLCFWYRFGPHLNTSVDVLFPGTIRSTDPCNTY